MAEPHDQFRHRWHVIVAVVMFATAVAGVDAQSNLGSGTTTPVAGDSGWQLYKNDHLLFQIEYPATWTVRSTEPYGDQVEFSPPKSDKTLREVVFGPVQPISYAWYSDFDEYVRGYERDTRRSGSRVLSRKLMSVDGNPAARLTYEYRVGRMTPQLLVDFLIGVRGTPEGIVYRFFYTTDVQLPADKNDDPVYLRMLSSLKILPPR
jgi:hypothetical protein